MSKYAEWLLDEGIIATHNSDGSLSIGDLIIRVISNPHAWRSYYEVTGAELDLLRPRRFEDSRDLVRFLKSRK